tara:strand:+ start:737 stop:1048 length:312 start_codon:yes stop_codon:yes gene_type:complete
MEPLMNYLKAEKAFNKKNKKGMNYGSVPGLIIVAVTIAIVLGVGATILDGIQSTQTADSYAYNATQDGLQGLTDLSGWQTTWMVILAAVVVLGLVAFFRRSSE